MDPEDVGPPLHGAQAVLFGPFVLERRLAVGGSAEVFLAHPRQGSAPAPRLVVKRLLPGVRSNDLNVLEQEARLHRAVRHSNVVSVFGAGVIDGEPYLAMEYVEGVDLYRLLRRAETELRRIPPGLAVYIARKIASALSAVHGATDASGNPLGIVHRDVTPSNVYLSLTGAVKLGDFGIARVIQRGKGEPIAGLKGKFGYLAPEQVAGEAFDHRADLFSLAVLLGEMLIGERIFPGSGQLAVLLSIRDVNIEPLLRARRRLPEGLFKVLERALARDPAARFPDAERLAAQLLPYEVPNADELEKELSDWVRWSTDSSQLARRIEGQIRDSVQRINAVRRASGSHEAANADSNRPTLSKVRYVDGHVLDSVPFPRLVEMIATGELSADDEVAFMGAEFRKVRDVDEIARHLLPSTTATTGRLFEPGAPDYQASLHETPWLEVLARMRIARETGALFVERRALDEQHSGRKEIYFERGRLMHVASSERAELLGEYLVRRGAIERTQLDRALVLLSERGSHLGDILVGQGWVDAMEVFRAIRDQGRDRVAAICAWPRGNVLFYRGTSPARVEFPLDLDLASPMMAGAIVQSRGNPRGLLPSGHTLINPGPRFAASLDRAERGTAPLSLQLIPSCVQHGATLDQALDLLAMSHKDTEHPALPARSIGLNEAAAALYTARLLRWIRF